VSEKQINRAQLLEELEKLQSKVKTMEMSETKYKYLFEKSQAVNMLVGKDGNILAVNNWAAELFGYDSKDLIGRDPLEFVVPEQQAKAQEQLGLVLQGVSTSSFEVNVIGKGGIRTLLFAEGKGILYHKGETVGVLLSALDITEHKRAEAEATTLTIERERAGEELRESEEKYRMLVEKVQDGFFIIQDGLMIFVNEAFASMAGYTVDEVIGMDFRKLIAPEDLAMVAERYKKRQEGKPVPPAYEFRMIHKDGKTIVNVFMTVGIIKYRGKAATIGTSQNITERKKAEEAILASERNYREIFNGANEIIFVHHPETGAVLDANQTACDVFGYTTDEILNLAIGELSSGEPPYTYKEAGELIQKAVKEGPQLYEWIAKDKKGRLFWCEFNLKIAVIGGEERILAVGRDITDRKQVEEALQESENRYRTLVETLQEGLGIVDPEENIVFANPALCDIFGYSSKEIIGMSLRDFVPKEDFQKILRETSRRKKGISSRYEVIIKRKDGELRDIRISTAPWMNEKGEFQGTIGVLLDMTEQKRAAAAVRESEEKLQTILESANDLVIQLTPTGFVKYLSPNCERLTGYKPEELIGKHMKKTTPPSEVPKTLIALKKALSGEVIRDFVINQIDKNGRIVPTEINITPVRKEGKIIAVQGIMRDVSERKQAEKAIRESEERYRSIFASSADALLVFDFNGNIVDASPTACEMYGYSIEEFIKLSSKDIVHPDYLHLPKQFNRDVRTKGMFRAESVDIRKDGTAFDIEVRGTKFHYAGEERLLAIVRDITKRKQAEKAIRESEGRFRSIAENIPGAVYMYYIFPDGTRSEQFMGPGLEDLIGKADKDDEGGEIDRLLNRVHPDDQEALHRAGDIALEKGETLDHEYQVKTNAGDYKWIRSIGRPTLMEDGSVRWQGVLIDIDERRRAEEALRESEEKFREIADLLPQPIYEVDVKGEITFISRSGFELSGYTIEDFVNGVNALQIVIPRDRDRMKKNIKRILQGEELGGTEYTILRKDGAAFPVIVYSTPVIRENKPVGLRGVIFDITERKQAEEALKASEEKFRSLFEDSRDTIFITSADGIMIDINSAGEELFGYTRSELLGMDVRQLYFDQNDRIQFVQEIIQTGFVRNYEIKFRRKDGEGIECLLTATIKTADDGKTILFQGIISDVTETRKLEEQFRQSQKMEAVGRLAGGVAHDFNNMLSVIIGGSELAMRLLKPYDPSRQKFEEIHKAAEHATNLTRQLLAFSRKQTLKPKVLDLNKIIVNMDKMLRRIIGEDVELETMPAPDLWKVKVDPGQIEQVILNMAVNARDAMPTGGRLTVETMNVELGDDYTRMRPGTKPGSYVMFTISDTGSGMTDEVKEHLFDPFFTTKESEKGTGLGLSTVYGIIKQSGGNIWVYSEAGKGSTFKIYLPKVIGEEEKIERRVVSSKIPRGSETIIVVEDDDNVRRLAVEMLETQGYKLFESRNGLEAFKICQKMEKPVDLVVTDVIMPGMSGDELAKLLRKELWPEVKVLFMSGHAENVVAHQGILEPGIPYLQKPLNLISFTQKVREVLDS